jgi:predicted ArsR family transcriptional regulator
MAAAIIESERDHEPIAATLRRAARRRGAAPAEEARRRGGARPRRAELVTAMTEALDEYGYEPRDEPDGLTMANCPFDALAKDYTDLVCGMNLDLMGGLVEGLGETGLEARLEPAPGRCCVRLRKTGVAAT